MNNYINELKQTTEQILAELVNMQEMAKNIDPNSAEGRELALAALKKINSLPDN